MKYDFCCMYWRLGKSECGLLERENSFGKSGVKMEIKNDQLFRFWSSGI